MEKFLALLQNKTIRYILIGMFGLILLSLSYSSYKKLKAGAVSQPAEVIAEPNTAKAEAK